MSNDNTTLFPGTKKTVELDRKQTERLIAAFGDLPDNNAREKVIDYVRFVGSIKNKR